MAGRIMDFRKRDKTARQIHLSFVKNCRYAGIPKHGSRIRCTYGITWDFGDYPTCGTWAHATRYSDDMTNDQGRVCHEKDALRELLRKAFEKEGGL